MDHESTIAALCLPAAARWSEPEVNPALRAWLADTGAMLSVDHVELRRTLLDAPQIIAAARARRDAERAERKARNVS